MHHRWRRVEVRQGVERLLGLFTSSRNIKPGSSRKLMPKAVFASEAVTKKVNSLNEELAGRSVRLVSVIPPNVTLKALGVPPSGNEKINAV